MPSKAIEVSRGAQIERVPCPQFVVQICLGMRVFRFFDANGGLKTLEHRSLRWKDARSFNDPFEILPRIEGTVDQLQEYLRAIQEELPPNDKIAIESIATLKSDAASALQAKVSNALREAVNTSLGETYRLLCTSLVNDSILMWSHYGDKHMGIVVEFETDKLAEGLKYPSVIEPVHYRTNRTLLSLNQLVFNESLEAFMWESLTTKSIHWSYEEEVRIFLQPDNLTGPEPLDLPFDPACVERIILGAAAIKATHECVNQLMGERDYAHTKVETARLHSSEYRLIVTGS